MGDARTQSPPTKNCAPESPTFGEIAGFNRTKCNARSPPGGTALMITVPAVPGKLIIVGRILLYIPRSKHAACGCHVDDELFTSFVKLCGKHKWNNHRSRVHICAVIYLAIAARYTTSIYTSGYEVTRLPMQHCQFNDRSAGPCHHMSWRSH